MAGQTDIVVQAILDLIDNGDVLPGDAIDEKAIIARHDVSRTPVREALIKLEADGLVQRNLRKGAVLFRPNVEEFLAILEVHANLESHAAALAAHRLTPDLAQQMKREVAACIAHGETFDATRPAEYYQLNLRFHETVALASGNPVLLAMIKTNARKLMAYYRMRYRYPGAVTNSAREHSEIAGHIFNHRSTEAGQAMAEHFNYDRSTIMDLIASIR